MVQAVSSFIATKATVRNFQICEQEKHPRLRKWQDLFQLQL